MAIKNCMHCIFGWKSQLWVVSMDLVAWLGSALGWELFFEVYDQLLDLEGWSD